MGHLHQVHNFGEVRWKYQGQVGRHRKQAEESCLYSLSTDPGTHQQQRNGPAAFSSDVQCQTIEKKRIIVPQ